MNKLSFTALIVLSIITQTVYSAEKQAQQMPTTGKAALNAREAATKWYMGTAVGVTGLVAFGLITFLASSDPTTYSHCHNCH